MEKRKHGGRSGWAHVREGTVEDVIGPDIEPIKKQGVSTGGAK